MPRPARAPVSGKPSDESSLSLFAGDGLHRFLAWIRFEHPDAPNLRRRARWGMILTWLPLVFLAALSDNLLVPVADTVAGIKPALPGWLGYYIPRESLLLDLATYAQFLGFIPLAFFAEGFIGRKIENGL